MSWNQHRQWRQLTQGRESWFMFESLPCLKGRNRQSLRSICQLHMKLNLRIVSCILGLVDSFRMVRIFQLCDDHMVRRYKAYNTPYRHGDHQSQFLFFWSSSKLLLGILHCSHSHILLRNMSISLQLRFLFEEFILRRCRFCRSWLRLLQRPSMIRMLIDLVLLLSIRIYSSFQLMKIMLECLLMLRCLLVEVVTILVSRELFPWVLLFLIQFCHQNINYDRQSNSSVRYSLPLQSLMGQGKDSH